MANLDTAKNSPRLADAIVTSFRRPDRQDDVEHARSGAALPQAKRINGPFVATLFQLVDLTLIAAISLVCLHVASPDTLIETPLRLAFPFIAGGVLIAWGVWALGGYRFSRAETLWRHHLKVLGGVALAGVLIAIAISPFDTASRTLAGFGAMLFASAAALAVTHAFALWLLNRWARAGRLAQNVVIVGATVNARRLIEANARTRDVNIIGVFEDRGARSPDVIGDVPVLGDIEDLFTWRDLPHVDKIIVAVTNTAPQRVSEVVAQLRMLPNAVALMIDLEELEPETTLLSQVADTPLATVSGRPYDERRIAAKRAQDLVIGTVMLIAFAPIMAACALAVKLSSPGPVIFKQARHGFNNQVIEVWKFRSMRVHSGPTKQVTKNDPRVTRIGGILRKTSLDELPQLINVIKGEMSLVGPRPHAVDMRTGDVSTASIVAQYAHRHRVKPGLTGWAQVNGSRGPVHTPDEVRRRIALDIDYIERASFWFDLWIMLRTAPALLGDAKNTR